MRHFQHKGALQSVRAITTAIVIGDASVVVGLQAVVDSGKGGINHQVATGGDGAGGGQHRQWDAISEYFQARIGEQTVISGDQANANAEGAGNDFLIFGGCSNTDFGYYVGQRVNQESTLAKIAEGVGQFQAVFGGLGLVKQHFGFVFGHQRRRHRAVDLEAALIDHRGNAAISFQAQDAIAGQAGVVA